MSGDKSARKPTILRAEDIAAMDGLAKTHFINARARRINKSLGDATGLTGFGIHLIEVAAGDLSSEKHVHLYEDECIYMLEGEATAIVGEREETVGPGDFIACPKGGEAHSLRNDGDVAFRCLVVGERRAHDVVDYPDRATRLFRNDGEPFNVVRHEDIDTPDAGKKA